MGRRNGSEGCAPSVCQGRRTLGACPPEGLPGGGVYTQGVNSTNHGTICRVPRRPDYASSGMMTSGYAAGWYRWMPFRQALSKEA